MRKEKTTVAAEGDSPIIKMNTKSRALALLLGVFIGLAVIIPGVSGSTIAIIFGLYTSMLYAIGNIFNDFKRCFAFLLPLGIGVVAGFLAGFLIIQRFFGDYMFEIVCLFVGLMIGALPAITREIKGEKLTPARAVLFPVGIIIPVAIGVLSIALTSGSTASGESFTAFPPALFLLYFPLGFVVSATQIIPGLSATAILMATGQFAPILNSLHLDYILENPVVLGLYASIGLGFLAGLVIISRIFERILKAHKVTAFFLVSGLSIGSIVSMFVNPDMWEVYTLWGNRESATASLIVGIVLLAIGFALSFVLTRYELNRGDR
jgi:putative membrane protein